MKKSGKKRGAKRSKKGTEAVRYEIRFAGSGGQGIITAARILAEAISDHEGKYVCQTQSYGPEARGGASKAEIVISDEPIDYPKVIKPDLFVAMNQTSCDAYFSDLDPNGLLIVDATLVKQIPTNRAIALPFTEVARKETGKDLAANMVALGAIVSLSRVVSGENLEKTLVAKVPPATAEMNTKAFQAGIRIASNVDMKSIPRAVSEEDEEDL